MRREKVAHELPKLLIAELTLGWAVNLRYPSNPLSQSQQVSGTMKLFGITKNSPHAR